MFMKLIALGLGITMAATAAVAAPLQSATSGYFLLNNGQYAYTITKPADCVGFTVPTTVAAGSQGVVSVDPTKITNPDDDVCMIVYQSGQNNGPNCVVTAFYNEALARTEMSATGSAGSNCAGVNNATGVIFSY